MAPLNLDELLKATATATEPTEVLLRDRVVKVLPPMDWPRSAMRAIAAGDVDTWALGVFADEDRDAWSEVDPTNREVVQFLADYAETAGAQPGESEASQS